MADADPRVEHFTGLALREVAGLFGARPKDHEYGVRYVYCWAWASCVSGRLAGIRARIPAPGTSVADIAVNRKEVGAHARVGARLARAVLDDEVSIASEVYYDDSIRAGFAVSAAILSVVQSLPVDATAKRDAVAMCVRTADGETINDGTPRGNVLGSLHFLNGDGPRAELRAALETFGHTAADSQIYNASMTALIKFASPVIRVKRPFSVTQNWLRNDVPKHRPLRQLAHADIDDYVDRRYAELDTDPFGDADASTWPTPHMLGRFPHPPDDAEDWLDCELQLGGMYEVSVDHLAQLSGTMRDGGFTHTVPVIDTALEALRDRWSHEEAPPLGDDPATVPTTIERLRALVADPDIAGRVEDRALAYLVGRLDAMMASASDVIAGALRGQAGEQDPGLSQREQEMARWLADAALQIAGDEYSDVLHGTDETPEDE